MEGITILNEEEITELIYNPMPLIILTIIGAIIGIVVAIKSFIDSGGIKNAIGIFVAFLGLGVSIGVATSMIVSLSQNNRRYVETRYEVTIDDSVYMKEFVEKYEIIEERGEIFVIKEKTN